MTVRPSRAAPARDTVSALPRMISPPEIVSRATSLSTQIDALQSELDSTANPHRVALRQLGHGKAGMLGGTSSPYDDAAFTIWADMERRQPDDVDCLQHLAIMHHARAIDREASKDPTSSNNDWQAAHRYWYKLWQNDHFWERLQARLGDQPKPIVALLRERLPALLLQVHYDIALDIEESGGTRGTLHHRSKFHVELVRKSRFPGAVKTQVQLASFNRFVATLPASVWQLTERNEEILESGAARIEQYLTIDPESRPALEEAIGVLARLVGSWLERLHADALESPANRALLQKIGQHAQRWRPFLDHLVTCGGRDDAVSERLAFWYRLMGEALRAQDQHAKAVGFFEQGLRAVRPGDEEHRRCTDDLLEALAYLARDAAREKKTDAKQQCDKLKDRADLTLGAMPMLAQAYVHLGAFDIVEEICRRGIAWMPDGSGDFDQIERMEQRRAVLQDLLRRMPDLRRQRKVEEHLAKATQLLEGGKPDEALKAANTAVEIGANIDVAYFVRARCHVDLGRFAEARADMQQFQRLDPDPVKRQDVVKDVMATIDRREAAVRSLGGRDAAELRNQAVTTFNAGRHDEAVALLRRAIRLAPTSAKLKEELSMVLTEVATTKAGGTFGILGFGNVKEALPLVREAIALDPGNQQAHTLLEQLNGLSGV
jgi:tetratricopeptide (TPR) repeat protein